MSIDRRGPCDARHSRRHGPTNAPKSTRSRPGASEERIARDPSVFASGDFFLPAMVENDPQERMRVLARLRVAAGSGIVPLEGAAHDVPSP